MSESRSVVSDFLRPHGLLHGILQARILEWVAVPFAQGPPKPMQAPGIGEGQGGLACCSPWGRKESDVTE